MAGIAWGASRAEWCLVGAGTYTSGQNDITQTIVYDYGIMKYEVTNAQYVDYLEYALGTEDVYIDNGYVYGYFEGDEHSVSGTYVFYDLGTPLSLYNYGQISHNGSSFIINVPSGYNTGDFDDHPVVKVSWFGANAYAVHNGWKLPTEQEWEKAARGTTGNEYPWGDVLNSNRANYRDSVDPWDNGTTPVGYYNGENGTADSPSPYGCYDMCGNVFDWTDSWSSTSRVMRGGSWNQSDDYLRSWKRGLGNPISTYYYIGFRCAWSNIPINPSPENGALEVPVNTTLSWECSDPQGDALTYDVYFGDIPELDVSHLVAEDIDVKSFNTGTLIYGNTYFWKVNSSDGGFKTGGVIWSFTTPEDELPVTLTTFTAVFSSDFPVLQWITVSEINNSGWNVYRNCEEDYSTSLKLNIDLIPGAGSSTEMHNYSYQDEYEVDNGICYYYWLESLSFGGESENFGPIALNIPEEEEEDTPPVPDQYNLLPNYPNPFNPDTCISYNLPFACQADLSIYNIKGKKIITLVKENQVAGYYSHVWDGKDKNGLKVSSGVYIYRIETEYYKMAKTMVLVK